MWRKRAWLVEVLRLYLGINLLAYGVYKLADLQFYDVLPSVDAAAQRLNGQPVSHLAPFPVFLLFFGTNRPYQVAAGAVECVAALLLLSRRTWPLGALACLAVLTNVVLVDLCYAVYSVWRNEAAMACLLLAGALLLIRAERERFLRAVRVLLAETPAGAGEAPAASTEITAAGRRAARRRRAWAVVCALFLFAGVVLLVDWATAGQP